MHMITYLKQQIFFLRQEKQHENLLWAEALQVDGLELCGGVVSIPILPHVQLLPRHRVQGRQTRRHTDHVGVLPRRHPDHVRIHHLPCKPMPE
jgi:hypothetical protein